MTLHNLELFDAFVARVNALPPQAWESIAARCAHLEGSSFAALRGRGTLFSRVVNAPFRHATRDNPLRIISATSEAVGNALGILGEIAREFKSPDATTPDALAAQAARQSNPQRRRYLTAHPELSRALLSREASQPGMTRAVRAAGYALLGHGLMSDDDFTCAYSVMEPQVPFAELR